jgi:hypothetical protein
VESSISQQPALVHRWLAAVPLFLIPLILVWALPRVDEFSQMIRELRLEIPILTKFALALGRLMSDYYFLFMPLLFILCWLHFGWAAKTRARLLWVLQVWFLLFVLTLVVFPVGYFLPMFKISTALRKK